jgi:predicted Zn-dependent protease
VLCLGALGIGLAAYLGYIDLGWFSNPTPIPVSLVVSTDTPAPPTATETPLPPTATPLPPPTELPTLTPLVIPGLEIEVPHITDEEEIRIGQETAREFEREFDLSRNAAYIELVNRIGNSILPYQPRQNIPFTFQVVETDELNAFALPGGFIYVTSGLIEYVRTDDELAAVMAHEIAHVALRHGAQQLEYLAGAQLVLDTLSTSEPDIASIYQDENGQLALQMAGMILLNGWGRGAELDADEYGAVYMHAAGYDVQAMIDLFTRFQSMEDSSSGDLLSRLLSTHPPFADRIARVQEAIITHGLED